MKELGSVLEKMLQRKSMWRQYRQCLIVEEWADAVGRDVAAVTRARQLKKGRLWVTVKDSTWSYHLSLLKPQLLKKLNEYAGDELVQEIYFQVGEINRQENQADMLNNNDKREELNDGPVSRGTFVRNIRRVKEQELLRRVPKPPGQS